MPNRVHEWRHANRIYFQWLFLTEDINNWPAGLEAHTLRLGVHTSKKVITDHCVFYTLKMANLLAKWKTTDWALHCFCQLKSSEMLKHLYQKSCYHQAYTSIQNDFDKLIANNIPFPFDLNRDCLITEDWNTISKSLLNHKAVYHKTCCDKIWPHIVNRVLNKSRCEDSDSHGTSSSLGKTRKSVGNGGDSADKSDRKQWTMM